MVSVTGLELAYSQAPQSMKSLVMAGWLMTTAIGNAIVAGIAEVHIFPEQSIEFFFYAGLMMLFVGIFVIITRNYQYVSNIEGAENDVDDDTAK